MELTQPVRRPGGAIATRPLDFIWICDTSGSMSGVKIERLNFAIADAIGPMREASEDNPQAKIFVRAVAFDDTARWIVSERTPLDQFSWTPLRVDKGLTAMGHALSLVARELQTPPFPEYYWPPVLVLVTDGFPTNNVPGLPNFFDGLQELMNTQAGRHASRLAIGIGDEADLNVLRQFIGNASIPPLQAKTAGELHEYIRWTSSSSIRRSTTPRPAQDEATQPFVPAPIKPTDLTDLTWSEPLN